MKDIQHLIRAGILALLVIIGFTIVRNLMVPESFGKFGHYRADAAEEEMDREPVYQGSDVCQNCHGAKHKEWKSGEHKTVNCEDCHGTANMHVVKPVVKSGAKTIFVDHSNAMCIRCHLVLPAQPHDVDESPHPQIDVKKHMKGKRCLECHKPHYPNLTQPEPEVVVNKTANVEQKDEESASRVAASIEKREAKPQAEGKVMASRIEIGKQVYQDKCMACHGKTGDGKTPTSKMLGVELIDFSAPSYKATISEIINITSNGKGFAMPAYRDELSEEEMQAVAKYIQGFKR